MTNTVNFIPFSEQGIRDNNEDAIALANDKYFIVCDGMGGHGHGKLAAQTVAESMEMFFQMLPASIEKSNLQAALDYAVERLNEKDVFDDERKMGTTVVLAAFAESSVLVGHVGDSRLYHIRPGYGLLFRTKDHSHVQEWIDAEIITEEEARVHPKRNLISRCVQPHPSKTIIMDIAELTELRAGDYLFLCTDGVNDAMTDDEIVNVISEYGSDNEKIARLKEICSEQSKDNFSGFLLKIETDIVSQIVPEIVQLDDKIEENFADNNDFVFCRNCGNKMKSEQNFCNDCGTSKIVEPINHEDVNRVNEQKPCPYCENLKKIHEKIKKRIDLFYKICTIAFFVCIIILGVRACNNKKTVTNPCYLKEGVQTENDNIE